MSLPNTVGIDITKHRYIVRGFADLKTSFKADAENFVDTRKELDEVVNAMVSKGLCVLIIPTHTVADQYDMLKSVLNL